MGRSVETVSNNVIYFDFTYDSEYDYLDLAEEDWQDLCENIKYAIKNKYPSMLAPQRKWVFYPYRENKILVENDHVQISISEYCGCGAVSVFVNPESEYIDSLSEHWLLQTWDTIHRIISEHVTVINRIGTMSNGCAIFEK